MLYAAFVFLVISLIAGGLGFTGVAKPLVALPRSFSFSFCFFL